MRKFVFIVGGMLLGWIGGSVVFGVLLGRFAYALDLDQDLEMALVASMLIVSIGFGGWAGAQVANKRVPAASTSTAGYGHVPTPPSPRTTAHAPQTTVPDQVRTEGGADVVHQLQVLADLHAQGVLDRAEFDAARSRLLK